MRFQKGDKVRIAPFKGDEPDSIFYRTLKIALDEGRIFTIGEQTGYWSGYYDRYNLKPSVRISPIMDCWSELPEACLTPVTAIRKRKQGKL